ncbi:acyl-CoA thioesterase [Plectonema cf. radiosum LEGE 06105]|uniref:Acyl-CoA thioesterase n=1 Tax=Plectonema cf. radiosum LEGE 06105 TaxID=945769 RepID=A0A8J7F2S2_9CYAN|nr:thioesterase family protein [Plectonema radiosum]MBE9215121.1 acyl-CoA thioesterase [Plectonema cf. radiosum LEGE 06105]
MLLSRPLEVEISISIKPYDIDFAGVVSNIVYIRWLEDLRLNLFDRYLPLDRQMQQGYIPVIAKTQIEYKRPIKLFDRIIAKMWISQLGKVKVTMEAEFISNNVIAATAMQTGSYINSQNNRPVRLPEELLQKYSQYKPVV